MLRDHGQEKKYYHRLEGYNGRLDAMQAGFLSVKLPHLEEWNRQRRAAAKRVRRAFAPRTGSVGRDPRAVSRQLRLSPLRDFVSEIASGCGSISLPSSIGTGIHYPVPLHLQEAYKKLGYHRGDFPVTERLASRILSLPMFPQLQVEQQQRVINAVLDFAAASNAASEPEMLLRICVARDAGAISSAAHLI